MNKSILLLILVAGCAQHGGREYDVTCYTHGVEVLRETNVTYFNVWSDGETEIRTADGREILTTADCVATEVN